MVIKYLNLKNRKKAQLKIQEMSFMLIAIVIFFIMVGLFFVAIQYRKLNQQSTILAEQKAISTISKLASTAEFGCGEPLCIDTDKIMVLKNKADYQGFWGDDIKSIEIVEVFPRTVQEEIECRIDNYPNCNRYTIYDKGVKNQRTVSTFVSLCRIEEKNSYIYEKCELGKIMAGYEIKQAGTS
jgi:hypothetical protein